MTAALIFGAILVVGYLLEKAKGGGGGIIQASCVSCTGATGGCMGNLSMKQIADVARNAGFGGNDLATAVAIAMAESSGNPNAVGDKDLAPTRGPSEGLWQINVGSEIHPEWNDGNNFDPQTNANRAYALYSRRGGSFEDWSTYTQTRPGTNVAYYVKYLGQAVAAAGISCCTTCG